MCRAELLPTLQLRSSEHWSDQWGGTVRPPRRSISDWVMAEWGYVSCPPAEMVSGGRILVFLSDPIQ